MNEHIAKLARWLAIQLADFGAYLETRGQQSDARTKFVNLAPTDAADKDGVYSDALLFAISDPKVFNIALTGPYGSGKSSIIQSFLKTYRMRPLHISLAAFAKESGKKDNELNIPEIERSILQQMLYGADSNKLPLSRFKRIQSPGVLSAFRSLYIILGLFSIWYAFSIQNEIISGSLFTNASDYRYLKLGIIAFGMAFIWAAVHQFYVASFGLSLKAISLKDIEIRPASDNQESILNRHLDEIIYFFQSTAYELVIIEDLDRFDDAEIFVTLREINRLVNENAGVKRPIRFLYALRDDVFANTDRTKFFEFIIPVIPIINSSNSIDMVLEQGKRLELDARLNRQFLREVSRYLDDLRLITNIFNEYAVYRANLETDDENILDPNKLLAVLIYKNVYPKDFELLHRGEGNLAGILGRYDDLVAHGEASFKDEIAQLEQRIEIAERQAPAGLKELRQIYAMAFIKMLPADAISVSLDGQQTWIPIAGLDDHEMFERMFVAQHVVTRNAYNQQMPRTDVSSLENQVDSQRTYLQRKEEIEAKSEPFKSDAVRRIRELRSHIANIRKMKFHEILRSSYGRIDNLFDGFGDKGDLARFLILEGHLDDSYYQYTSLFHSGRLSPNDNKFLIQIRAFITPTPEAPIDNPKEVIAAMRDEDFSQNFVLNVKLVDCLLAETNLYSGQVRKFLDLIASNFAGSEEFLSAYYTTGSAVSELLSQLASAWDRFVPSLVASKRNLMHATQTISHLPQQELAKVASQNPEFAEFVASELPEILELAPELAPERLEMIDFEISDLSAIASHPGIVRFMVHKGLFELSADNVEYVYREILGESDIVSFHEQNYTRVRAISDPTLMARIERDFDLYVSDVLLKLDDNIKEDPAAMLDILSRDDVSEDNLRRFIERQTKYLPTLDGVPERSHILLFEVARVEPTWQNCTAFMGSSGFTKEALETYLDRDDVRSAIVKRPLANTQETLRLRQLLVNAQSMRSESYREYCRAIPNKFRAFPSGLDPSKLTILIEEKKISFSKENFDSINSEADLSILFLVKNIGEYLAAPESFQLNDESLEALLRSTIADNYKRAIIDLIDLSALPELPERAALIGPIIDRTNVNLSNLDAAKAQSIILHSRPVETQISLFNKLHRAMTIDGVRETLERLAKPFSEITTGYHTPRLPKSDRNRQLVLWLEERGVISSWSDGGTWFSGDVIRVNLKRR